MKLKRRRRRVLVLLAVVLGLSLAYWAWDHRHYWIAHNFRVVVPGRVYCGGYQYPGPLSRIIRRYRIRTVLTLRGSGSASDRREQEVLRKHKVRFIRVAIPQATAASHLLEAVERAATTLADPRLQPIYVHCWGGKHRTGAVIGVYRVKYCGWSEQRALAEMQRWKGCSDGCWWPVQALAKYCVLQALRDAGSQSLAVDRPAGQRPPGTPPLRPPPSTARQSGTSVRR